jgi:hypothetical protein
MIEVNLLTALRRRRKSERDVSRMRAFREANPELEKRQRWEAWRKDLSASRAMSRNRPSKRNGNERAPSPLDIPDYREYCARKLAVHYKADRRPKVSFTVDRFTSDERMLTFLGLVEWHANLFVGMRSTMVDTVSTMVWGFGKVGDMNAPALRKALGITNSGAHGRMRYLRKHIPSLHAYAYAAGILEARHTAD